MDDEKSFGKRLGEFLSGKGYYLVLALCAVVIGISIYALLTSGRIDADVESDAENLSDLDWVLSEMEAMVGEPATTPEIDGAQESPDVEASAVIEEEEPAVYTETAPEPEPYVHVAQFIWPLEGRLELPFSITALIYNARMGDWRTNDGIYIAAELGTQVLCVSSGRVARVFEDNLRGTTVIIEHPGGLQSIYSNLAAMPTVVEGDDVMIGQVIGSVGTTAIGEGPENPHLRFAMTLDGHSIDPMDFLPPR